MALLKEKELSSGVIVNYHRVVSVNNITNQSSNIEVGSYISESQREKEHRYQELQKKSASGEEMTEEEKKELEKGIDVYINTKYYITEYDKELNVDTAYDYLKTLEEFKDAEDC